MDYAVTTTTRGGLRFAPVGPKMAIAKSDDVVEGLMDSNGNLRPEVDLAALDVVLARIDELVEGLANELLTIRGRSRRDLGAADGGVLYKKIGRLGVQRHDLAKARDAMRARKSLGAIEKSRGSILVDLQAERRELRKCADSAAAQKLDGPTERRLRQALMRLDIEIDAASR